MIETERIEFRKPFAGQVQTILGFAGLSVIVAVDEQPVRRLPTRGWDQIQVRLPFLLEKDKGEKQVVPQAKDLFPHEHIVQLANRFDLHIPIPVRLLTHHEIDPTVVNLRRVNVETEQHEMHLGEILRIAADLHVIETAPIVSHLASCVSLHLSPNSF
ncbi:hypothetical protein ACFOHS_22310 [Jhaorihella thermophila]